MRILILLIELNRRQVWFQCLGQLSRRLLVPRQPSAWAWWMVTLRWYRIRMPRIRWWQTTLTLRGCVLLCLRSRPSPSVTFWNYYDGRTYCNISLSVSSTCLFAGEQTTVFSSSVHIVQLLTNAFIHGIHGQLSGHHECAVCAVDYGSEYFNSESWGGIPGIIVGHRNQNRYRKTLPFSKDP